MRHSGVEMVPFALLVSAAMTGCITSEPISPGQLDELWQVTPSRWSETIAQPLTIDGREIPNRYEIVYEPSVAWSVIELHRTAEHFGESTGTVRFPISSQHARAMATLLGRLAHQTARIADALKEAGRPGADRRWATATAELVGHVHQLTVAISPDPAQRAKLEVDDTAAWVLVPLLELLVESMDGQAEAAAVEQTQRLLQAELAITRVLLTMAFRLSGRRLPEEALRDVLQAQRTQPASRALRNTAMLLLWHRHTTPQTYEPMRETAAEAARVADRLTRGLRYLADLTEQWPKVNFVAVEIRRLEDRHVIAAEFDIKAGQQVILRDLDALAPRVVFAGHGRVIVQYEGLSAEQADVSVLFESDDESGITLDFDTPVYALVRAFAFPLQTARLREIRYRSRCDAARCKGRQVDVLMESADPHHRRSMIRVQSDSSPRFKQRDDLPPQLLGREETVRFEFLNEQRCWHYEHSTFEKPELWGLP